MDEKTNTVLRFLQHEIKKSIDAHYALDCCIAATRIALDVLTHFQIEAVPVVTRVLIFNSHFREWVEANKRLPNPDEMEPLIQAGGWSMMLGAPNTIRTVTPTKGRGFAGHLIAHLPKERMIVDLSLPQGTRPRQKIRLHPLIANVNEDFIESGGTSFKYPQKEGGDVLLDYSIISNDHYKESVDWASDKRKVVSYPAIAEIDQLLRSVSSDDSGDVRSDPQEDGREGQRGQAGVAGV